MARSTRHHRRGIVSVIALAGIAATMLFWGPRPEAATQLTSSVYPLLTSPERMLAMIDASNRRLPYVPGEVIVKFRGSTSTSGIERALQAIRSRPSAGVLRWSGGVALLRDASEPDPRVLAATLRRQPEVLYAEPNYLVRPSVTPNDPGLADRQWNLEALDMPRAWDISPGGTNATIVAVVDTGMTTTTQSFSLPLWTGSQIQMRTVAFATNPDFSSARFVAGKDFAFWDGPVLDTIGHGTHVGATIGEDANNGLAEAGIAYNVRLMPVKVCLGFWDAQFTMSGHGIPGSPPLDFGTCEVSAIAAGIRYAADNGASAINLSLGEETPSATLREAIVYAVGKGVFVAIAGGNSFEDGNPADYPASDAAAIDGAMSVGAVGRSLTRAFYSSTASGIEIAAPGGSDRDGGLSGLIWQSSLFEPDFDPQVVFFPRFDRYAETPKQGTSMAAPHITATAALLMSRGIRKPAAVEAAIRGSARDLGAKGADSEFGAGLVQPRAALRGFGLVTK